MGDQRRFDLFAKLAKKHFDREMKIVDVAGGKGYLQLAMREQGFSSITTWDVRSSCTRPKIYDYRYQYFDYQTKEDYQGVIAMHPDEGTDHALLYAVTRKVPALISPCCIKPHAVTFWGKHKYDLWCQHLEKLVTDNNCYYKWTRLRMSGRNDALIIKPYKF